MSNKPVEPVNITRARRTNRFICDLEKNPLSHSICELILRGNKKALTEGDDAKLSTLGQIHFFDDGTAQISGDVFESRYAKVIRAIIDLHQREQTEHVLQIMNDIEATLESKWRL